MSRPIFFVGSSPCEPSETFRQFGQIVGDRATRFPDGQRTGWMPGEALRTTAGLVPGHDEPIQATAVDKTFRPAPGVAPSEIAFSESLFYGQAARDAYRQFRVLRDHGEIPAHTRYQMSMPTPFTACLFFDWDVVRALWPQYEAALFAEVDEMLAEIPHRDLAISWDVVAEFMITGAVEVRDVYDSSELLRGVARCLDKVPADVEVGLHFCYGGHNSNGNLADRSAQVQEHLQDARRELSDTALMADYFNRIREATSRPINWIHMPVPREHDDDEYFRPLSGLELGDDTELFLGIVHLTDDADASRRKLRAAQKALDGFGVAAACGLGTIVSGLTEAELPAMLARHAEVADLVG